MKTAPTTVTRITRFVQQGGERKSSYPPAFPKELVENCKLNLKGDFITTTTVWSKDIFTITMLRSKTTKKGLNGR